MGCLSNIIQSHQMYMMFLALHAWLSRPMITKGYSIFLKLDLTLTGHNLQRTHLLKKEIFVCHGRLPNGWHCERKFLYKNMCKCIYIYMYVCMYVYMYVYIYMYIYVNCKYVKTILNIYIYIYINGSCVSEEWKHCMSWFDRGSPYHLDRWKVWGVTLLLKAASKPAR